MLGEREESGSTSQQSIESEQPAIPRPGGQVSRAERAENSERDSNRSMGEVAILSQNAKKNADRCDDRRSNGETARPVSRNGSRRELLIELHVDEFAARPSPQGSPQPVRTR